jgi:hypothetical protein
MDMEMNGQRMATLMGVALLFLAPRTVEAAGTITGLAVSPSPATVGTTVTVTINGTGVCDELELDFGDGTAKPKFQGNPFPIQTQHPYAQVKTFQLKASPKKACSGQATASHTVVQSGQITGLSVPASASPNTQVPITVQGTGTCGSLQLDFGDGAKATLSQATFPTTAQHPYATTGTKTLKATAGAQCQGQATASLTVKSSLVELCTKVNCADLLSAVVAPKIDQVVPFISNITPGGAVAIKGSGLGAVEGKLYLKGLKKYNGVDLGPVEVPIAKEPGKDFWNPTNVLGFIPGNITQVMDQPATLQIKTAGNKWSNEYPLNFKAAKEFVMLPYTDPAVKLIACGTDSNRDVCNEWADPDDGLWFASICADTFYGFHLNVWGAIGDDVGTDKFEITLKNGWVIDGGKVYVYVDQGEGYTLGPGTVPVGVTSWKPSVQWNVSPNDDLCHGADVYISGPKGVPWK